MASFEEHCRDCERILGDRCEAVNRWLDECFRQYGPHHRFKRHHTRGVEEAGRLFGELGRKAAMIHIFKDCGHIPRPRDYEDGTVTVLGMDEDEAFGGYWDPWQFDTAVKSYIGV